MNVKYFGALLCCVASLQTVPAQDCLASGSGGSLPPNPNGKRTLYNGQQEFSLRLLQAINELNPTSNIFFSPYSTYHALLVAYFIAANSTESYLKKVLKMDAQQTKTDIYSAYKLDKMITATRGHNADGGITYEFSNANRIYVEQDVDIRECMRSLFEDELQSADFKTHADTARRDINKWVETRTHDMIKNLLPPGSIDQTTNLVLVNAAHFKGVWENKFDASLTKLDVFYISPSNQTFVDMMHMEGTFNYDTSEDLKAHILELPYKGNEISMYILLPPFVQTDGVATILKRLTLDKFKSIVGKQSTLLPRTVNVSLPKFNLEHTIELVPVLDKLHVGDLFTQNADFSMLSTRSKVTLGNALHKAKIELNEEGTKAAAATVMFSFRSSRPAEPALFNCNHPFVYVIYDKREQAILFQGIFRRPY